jgi:hypothetical protein
VSGDAAHGLALGPPRLATAPRADRLSVEELVAWVRQGKLRLPRFQRPLRWEDTDRLALLDSLERGYPVGTLLLWRRPASAAYGSKPITSSDDSATEGDVLLIVDGQQRTVTLWDALGVLPETSSRAMGFEFEVERPDETGAFVMRRWPADRSTGLPKPVLAQGKLAVPLALVLDATSLSEAFDVSIPRDARRRCFDLGKRLREYLIPIYVFEGADVEVGKHVFDRINSTGKRLERQEIFEALLNSDAGGLAAAASVASEAGFGTVDPGTVLKAFEAVTQRRIGTVDAQLLARDAVERELRDTGAALRRACSFLVEHGVPNVRVMPYELPLVVLSRFFHLFPAAQPRTLAAVAAWFWRGSLAGLLGGASGSLQQHVDDVVEGEEVASVARLAARTGQLEVDLPLEFDGAQSVASARGKLALCALFASRPRDLDTGDRFEAVVLFDGPLEKGFRKVFASVNTDAATSFANRLSHPRRDRAPLLLLRDCRDAGALISHGVTLQAHDALIAERRDEFLQLRSNELRRLVEGEWRRRTDAAALRTPSVAQLLESAE